eukprot:SAG31_NODE_816_length_11865_cov_38.805116_15_plen_84_part_00
MWCEWSEMGTRSVRMNATHCGLCLVDNRVSLKPLLLSSPAGRRKYRVAWVSLSSRARDVACCQQPAGVQVCVAEETYYLIYFI